MPAFRPIALALLLLGGAGLVWAQGGATPPEKPDRVVSLNLCADQLLLPLADRDQIAGLTRNADDPQMSAEARAARGLPILTTSAEEIVATRPDLVVGMPASGSPALTALPGQRYTALDLNAANTFAEIEQSIRETATAIGHPERGEALIAGMKRELAQVPRVGEGRTAAYYQRRGYLTGSGTLIDEIMTRVGLVNLATRIGKPALSQVSLEEMVAARPDFLIVEQATARVADQGTEMLHHPALSGIPRVSIPQAWTVCGGRAYVLAARAIARQVGKADVSHR